MCIQPTNYKFSNMGQPHRVWAVSSIHGDINRLINIHDAIFNRIKPGDRVVYLGNYTGHGDYSRETIEEILLFRRLLMAKPGMKASDLVYLKGKQEANWQRLMQLQFEMFPTDSLLALLGTGMGRTLESYGLCPHDGIVAARAGSYALSKWVTSIRHALVQNQGHDAFMMHQVRAAYTNYDENRFPLLFVSSGINLEKSLDDQQTSFWESDIDFREIHDPYNPFEKIIRGFDKTHQGIYLNGVSASLDGGCGFGGSLVCASMTGAGDIDQLMEA